MTKAATRLCMGCMRPSKGQNPCPHCGWDVQASNKPGYIEPGSLLASRYIIGRLAHKNGEGALYIAYDNNLQTPCWVQEYFPHTIAERGVETGNILPLQGFGAQYKALMSDFVDTCNEVKRLAISEPVVPIDNIVYENNTVYAVYKDMNVIPLETWLEEQGGRLPVDQALAIFLPLMNTLGNIHNQGYIHRGISPYTIHVAEDGRLYLWGFALSATRTENSELSAELFSGYSAPEQYASNGWQGTWTDVYAAGALLYRVLSGVVPPKSTLMGQARPLVPLESHVPDIPQQVSEAIDAAMKLKADERTQVMATLSSRLLQAGEANTAVYDTNVLQEARRRQNAANVRNARARGEEGSGSGKYIGIALGLTVLLLIVAIVFFMTRVYPSLAPGGGGDESSSEETSEQGSTPEVVYTRVPAFVGQTATSVQNNSQYEPFFTFTVQEEFNEDYAEGIVYDQSPVEDSRLADEGKTSVTLFVSKGRKKIEMPDVVGKPVTEAIAALVALEPSLDIQVFTVYNSDEDPNTVVSTQPGEGNEIDPKQHSVYLFVAPEKQVEDTSSRPEEPSRSSSSEEESSSRGFFWYE